MKTLGHSLKAKQWTLLAALTAGHFVVDSFPGMLHTLLPEVQNAFGFNISTGATLLMFFLLAANGIQVVIGHLRPDKTQPVFLYLGLLCSLFIGGIILLPKSAGSFWPAVGVLLICGAGVGMTHPEFMRALHTLSSISSAVGTTVFMAGGVAGFAFGGWTATELVKQWGFTTLWYFCGVSIIMIAVLLALQVRLAREGEQTQVKFSEHNERTPFWPVYVMAVLGGSSSSVLVWAVPQSLDKLGFDIDFGGFSVMLFSLAGGIGGILVSRWASRRGELLACMWLLLAGIPFAFGYAMVNQYRWGVLLLTLAGLFCYGAYPLMVSMARQTGGANFGQRMGFIIGGTWLIASFVPRMLAPVAEKYGLHTVLLLTPAGYLAAAGLAGYLRLKTKKENILIKAFQNI